MRAKLTSRPNIAQIITDAIVLKLAQGVKPWRKTWTGVPISRPLRAGGEAYSGINCIFLWAMADLSGYMSPHWMTYCQAAALGGQVRTGEKSSWAVFYKLLEASDPHDETERDEHGSARRVMRHFHVFNADQIDGLPARFHPNMLLEPLRPCEQRAEIDALFERIPVSVTHGGSHACYRPAIDMIELPHPNAFENYTEYAGTRLHEIFHAIGSKHRLNWNFKARFGDHAYHFEECVVELASAIASADLGLPDVDLDNHAAYIGHWIAIFNDDPKAIFHAAAKAEEAVTYFKQFI